LLIFAGVSVWHGYDREDRKQAIKSNPEFWIAKVERNMLRDREVNAYYQCKGWMGLRVLKGRGEEGNAFIFFEKYPC
jgi:DNA mismatch endonuclease, patch repair protein